MDKNQKGEYIEGIEEYLEDYKVYDYFYELMKDIILHRPKNPIDFLIERISKSECYRCVIVGPPGFSRLGLGRLVAGKIGWKYLSMTDWIGKEKELSKEKKEEHKDEKKEEHKDGKKDGHKEEHKENLHHVIRDDATMKEVRDNIILPDAKDDIKNSKIYSEVRGVLSGRNIFLSDQQAITIFK